MLYGIRARIISEIDAEAKESFGTELATCKLSTTQLCAAFGSGYHVQLCAACLWFRALHISCVLVNRQKPGSLVGEPGHRLPVSCC